DAAAVAVAGVVGTGTAGQLLVVAIIVRDPRGCLAGEIASAHGCGSLGEDRGGGQAEKKRSSRESGHVSLQKKKAPRGLRAAPVLLVLVVVVVAAMASAVMVIGRGALAARAGAT